MLNEGYVGRAMRVPGTPWAHFVSVNDGDCLRTAHIRLDELPAALTGDRHTAQYAPDGRLFVSFRDRTLVSPTFGDWVAWVGTFDDIVHGREGQYRVRLMDNKKGADCAYPGVEVLPDGTMVTTTYGHWTARAAPYIVSVRFQVGELDALAKRAKRRAVGALRPLWRRRGPVYNARPE